MKNILFLLLFSTLLFSGIEDIENYTKNVSDLFEKAKTDKNAMVELGVIYMEGSLIEKNSKEAIRLFSSAAEKGSMKANLYLGTIYEEEEKNFYVAKLLYKEASKNGIADASYNLAVLYHFGENGDNQTNVDKRKAYVFYKRAIAQGKQSEFAEQAIKEICSTESFCF